ncbi:unnamed protein product [marine sediment metagenome]|uniref:Uncharacterized protein n=1 Tax=marine sediment metagenome TaxID=412755 RepID=X1JDJ8_9ZZZZ
MENKKQLSRGEKAEPESFYFTIQASWGLTKHMGGLEATRELIEACHIDKDSYVLDVGCIIWKLLVKYVLGTRTAP